MIHAIAVLALFGLAAGPTTADLPDAALLCSGLGEPVTQGAPGPAAPVYCQADCGSDPDVSCSGSVSCQAVDRSCPYQRGYVVCDGYYTYCPKVCPQCEEGTIRLIGTGTCCDYPSIGEEKLRQKCINEQWVTQAVVCRRSPACPFIP